MVNKAILLGIDRFLPSSSQCKRVFLICSLLLIWVGFPLLSYAEGFKVVKVGSHYEPILKYSDEEISLLGGKIKAGPYAYDAGEFPYAGKIGFFKPPSTFYYVDSDSGYTWSGSGYGVCRNYFIADGPGFGSTGGYDHLLFLFSVDTKSIKLLDVIGEVSIGDRSLMDFIAAGKSATGREPLTLSIKDPDNNGHPQIQILIVGIPPEPPWSLFMEIIGDKLVLNLNPHLYVPLFKQEILTTKKTGIKSDAYYIYGFLAKKIGRKTITADLQKDQERSKIINDLLDTVPQWNAAFHNLEGRKFEIKQYNLEGGVK
jgi:hypothetical protein